jgi:RNA polymerase sigma factor (sigma-70 family)
VVRCAQTHRFLPKNYGSWAGSSCTLKATDSATRCKQGINEGGAASVVIKIVASTPTYEDRELVASLFERHAPLLRSRIRRSLSPSVRRLFDSQDLLSTLRRRVDSMAAKGEILAQSEEQFVALILTMARHATVDKARIAKRLHETPFTDDGWEPPAELVETQNLEELFAEIFRVLSPDDTLLVNLWLQDVPREQTAELLGCTTGSVSHRWRRIREQIRSIIKTGIEDRP